MTTNRERTGKALELARDGLRPFVERCFRKSAGGLDQAQEFLRGTEYEDSEDPLADIAVLIRLLRIGHVWRDVFESNLRRTVRGEVRRLVGELGSVRNRWAHQEAFSDEDTERALDTVGRLLRAINAKEAERAREMRDGYREGRREPPPVETEPPPAPAPETPAEGTQPPESAAPPVATGEDAQEGGDSFREAADREIQRLRAEIAAKRATREGLDARRDYLEEDQVRIAKEFRENQRRIAQEIAGVDGERKDAAEEIQRLEARLRVIGATIAPPPLDPAPEPVEESRGEPAPEERRDEQPDDRGVAEEPTICDPPARASASETTADLVCELLAETGRALHFREIYERLESREPRPPRSRGGDPAIAYLARYSSDPRLERTRRGVYRLKGARAPSPPSSTPPQRRRRTARGRAQEEYRGKEAVAWTLLGERHEAPSFKEVLLGVCGVVCERSPAAFERVLTMRGRVRPCFSRNPADLHTPEEVGGSGIFAETKLGAADVVERCRRVLRLCGYDAGAFSVEARARPRRSGRAPSPSRVLPIT